jgi:anti-sigma regulatory factor (Ser/Thr protein kinase)
MVTAVFGILDPQTGTFTYATAGHPAPIIALPDGTVQKLPKDGIPLGIADSTESSDWTFTLPAGSLLALYTDGLIEYTRDVIAGEERLLAALREEIVEPATAPARSLVSRVFRDIKNADDVAVLGVAMEDAPAKDFTFDFTGIPVAVPLVRRSLQRYLRTLDLTPDDRFAVITSIGEALANAVEHAYSGGGSGIVRLRVSSSDDVLTATVEDDGRWRPAQRHEERGRGLPMMRALMSGVEIQTNQARTSVRLTLELSA